MESELALEKFKSRKDILEPNYKFQINSQSNNFETNAIMTSKYNFHNFLPKILFTQFSQLINWYFIIISICEVN